MKIERLNFLLRSIAFCFSVTLTAFAPIANADQIVSHGDRLGLTCEKPDDCLRICGSTTCEIANLSCAGCARSADPAMIAIFRSFHLLYQRSASPITKDSFGRWLKAHKVTAIGVDSPLNIFADPFNPGEQLKLQGSFDKVCLSTGRHFVLTEVASTMKPRAIVCEVQKDVWSVFGLGYRPEYSQMSPSLELVGEPTGVIP